MDVSLGIDFGTTYSVVAKLKDASLAVPSVEAVRFQAFRNSAVVDSIVAEDTSLRTRRYFGRNARTKAAQPGFKVYKGFKMLLSEAPQDVEALSRLQENGFENREQPAEITKEFLTKLIEQYRQQYPQENVSKITIGVPEIWFDTSFNCRRILKNIVEEIIGTGNVQLESEPKLACAFFVYNYKIRTGNDFAGHILLIDYGGGTLDITICEVDNHNGTPIISIKYKDGAGANTQKKIGSAGLLYQQEILNLTLMENGVREEDIQINNSYYYCLHRIEDSLLSNQQDIGEVFSANEGAYPLEEINDQFGEPIVYNDRIYTVKYGTLFKAYRVIERILGEKLADAIAKMDELGINYADSQSDSFKIALVGGFCSFFLTRRQIETTAGLTRGGTYDDRRYYDFDTYLANEEDRENAVAYGAALLANDLVSFKRQAPYSLSLLPLIRVNGVDRPNLEVDPLVVFEENDEIVFDQPYFARAVRRDANGQPEVDKNGNKIMMVPTISASRIPFIMKSVGRHNWIERPSQALNVPDFPVRIGFSLNRNMELSMLTTDTDGNVITMTELHQNINDLLGGIPYHFEEEV